jgi:hypothetical protein
LRDESEEVWRKTGLPDVTDQRNKQKSGKYGFHHGLGWRGSNATLDMDFFEQWVEIDPWTF